MVTTTCRDRIGAPARRADAPAAPCSSHAPAPATRRSYSRNTRREKARLPQHALGARVGLRVARERLGDQLLEPRDLLRLPAEQVVEAEDLGDEAGAHLERRHRPLARRRVGGGLRDRVALERAKPPRRIRQPRVQPVVQLVARDEIGKRDRAPPGRSAASSIVRRSCRAAPRVGTTTRRERTTDRSPSIDRAAMADRNVVQVGDADESRAARRDQGSWGGFNRAWMSLFAPRLEHEGAGGGRRGVPGARHVGGERRLAADAGRVRRELGRADEQRVRLAQLVGRMDRRREPFDVLRHAAHRRQRAGRRAGERPDVLERRLEPREQRERLADRLAVCAKHAARASPSGRAPGGAAAPRRGCACTAATSDATASGRRPPSSASRARMPAIRRSMPRTSASRAWRSASAIVCVDNAA